jgi:Rrf2 family transcriptional regulator, cysteine metabolism repressor
MTLLSRKADYALLILAFLYERAEGANARTIAERYSLSRSFVANILKELAGKGFLTSHRGVKGGYALLRSVKEITLANLLDAIDENFKLTICASHEPTDEVCSLEPCCPVKTPLAEIHRRLSAVLRDVTLADLFHRHEPVGRAAATLLPLLTIHHPSETTA